MQDAADAIEAANAASAADAHAHAAFDSVDVMGAMMPMDYDFDGFGELPSPTSALQHSLVLDGSMSFPPLDGTEGLGSPTSLALGLSFTNPSVELLNALENDLSGPLS